MSWCGRSRGNVLCAIVALKADVANLKTDLNTDMAIPFHVLPVDRCGAAGGAAIFSDVANQEQTAQKCASDQLRGGLISRPLPSLNEPVAMRMRSISTQIASAKVKIHRVINIKTPVPILPA